MSTLRVDAIRHNSATSDAITTHSDGTASAKIIDIGGGQLSHRNVIRNGHMQVIQRGSPLTVNANIARGRTCADGWEISSDTNGTGVFSSSKSTDTPNGFGSSLKLDVTTADTSIAADVGCRFLQRFEGQDLQAFKKGSSDALQFTLSFHVKSPKTGTHCIELLDIDNNRSVSATYTVSQADTWQYVTHTFPADTTGAFTDDNGQSFIVVWWLAAGSNFTSGSLATTWGTRVEANRAVGQVNVLDNTANNFYITGCQLEVGDTATTFEHRSYGEEFARCQRYYQQYVNISAVGYVPNNGSRTYSHGFFFPVEMRSAPTMSITNTGSSNGQYITDGSGNAYVSSVLSQGSKTTHMSVSFNISTDLTDYRGAYLFGTGNTTYQTTYKITAEL